MTPITPLEHVSLTEAAAALGFSRAQAYRLAKTGELVPGVPVLDWGPRLKRVPKMNLERYIAQVTGESVAS